MAGIRGKLLAVVALAVLATGRTVHAQEPHAVVLGAPTPTATWPPPDYKLPSTEESTMPPLNGDPLLDQPQLPPPGWFLDMEAGLIGPHFKDRLFGPVPLGGGSTATIHVPSAGLDWTVSPRFEFGYRLPRGFGELLVGYRFLTTEGEKDVFSGDGAAHLKSRLNLNVLNLDYANRDPLWSTWEMRWRVGVEVAGVFYDTRSEQRGAGDGTGAAVEQRASNDFVSGGPHAGLELWDRLPFAGLALYGQVEGASLLGELRQSFEETFLTPGTGTAGGASRNPTTQGVGVLGVRLGLSWLPPGAHGLRLFLGYQLTEWWQLGRNDRTGSLGNLTEQGLFFRGEFTF